MRLFYLYRKEDVTGYSGTGFVGAGIQLPDLKCVFGWLTKTPSVVIHDTMDMLEEVHGHNGKTIVLYDDLDWVDKDGYPVQWAAEGFYDHRPSGGGPWWPNEKDFVACGMVRPSFYLAAKNAGRKVHDPMAWAKFTQQFAGVVASMHEAAADLASKGDTVVTMTGGLTPKPCWCGVCIGPDDCPAKPKVTA